MTQYTPTILNLFAKPCISLAQTVFRLIVDLDLEPDCQTRWYLWLKIFLDWQQLCCYKFTAFVSGEQN